VNDKWDEKEPEKGHKLVDAIQRCVEIPDDSAAPKYSQDCKGKYEYMPDSSWKGAGTCTDSFKGGDKRYETWKEGSHLKEYLYEITGGTGTYQLRRSFARRCGRSGKDVLPRRPYLAEQQRKVAVELRKPWFLKAFYKINGLK
jgi:hypothetical protein